MPPAQRRAAIIETTIPLLLEFGSGVTTRQIAEAAGIAEGTIFRVFPDKDQLIDAVVEQAFDPVPTQTALDAIDRGLTLDERLIKAVEVLQERVEGLWRLMSAIGTSRRPGPTRPDPPDLSHLAALFEPDRDQLRRDPMVAARVLHGLTFASSHPMLSAHPLPPAEIVSLVLDGIRTSHSDESPSC